MYRQFILIMTLVVSVLMIPTAVNAAEHKTVTLDIPSMTCGICPITIKKALTKVTGVTAVKSDFQTKTTMVTFNPEKTNIKALTKATANAGYPSSIKKIVRMR